MGWLGRVLKEIRVGRHKAYIPRRNERKLSKFSYLQNDIDNQKKMSVRISTNKVRLPTRILNRIKLGGSIETDIDKILSRARQISQAGSIQNKKIVESHEPRNDSLSPMGE